MNSMLSTPSHQSAFSVTFVSRAVWLMSPTANGTTAMLDTRKIHFICVTAEYSCDTLRVMSR